MNERLAVTRRVLRAMRHASARGDMGDVVNQDGVPQVVVCLPGDTIAYAQERVAAVGGRATVVTPHGPGLVPLGWHIGRATGRDSHDGPMHPDSTMGMLLTWMAETRTSECAFVITAGEISAEVTEGEQIQVPA